jgi:hypothetical protein
MSAIEAFRRRLAARGLRLAYRTKWSEAWCDAPEGGDWLLWRRLMVLFSPAAFPDCCQYWRRARGRQYVAAFARPLPSRGDVLRGKMRVKRK